MSLENLLSAARAQHFDGGLVAIDKQLLLRIEEEDCVGAALEQQSEHGLIVPDQRVGRTGPFGPLSGFR